MSTPRTLLIAEKVGVRLAGRQVVDEVSLTLGGGRLIALVGPNGAGKTTLLRALAGLVRARGEILLGDRPLIHLSARERARAIAYLPQGHEFAWPMPVATVVALGRTAHADPFGRPSEADAVAVREALAATATEALADRPVTALSGGERARVALARALAAQAPILLADEPTMSLDPRHQLVVMNLLRKAAHDGTAVLVVVHDLALAARFADTVLMMAEGRAYIHASPELALAPHRLADVFGIEATTVEIDGKRVPIVRQPL
ncbi:MAG TPA: ABC transporter ATP-binding protein [Xanthobacteraceae bacterium]|nr:ABC transporter ATP-binding protein [Xanthobacteraceae bacterium]